MLSTKVSDGSGWVVADAVAFERVSATVFNGNTPQIPNDDNIGRYLACELADFADFSVT